VESRPTAGMCQEGAAGPWGSHPSFCRPVWHSPRCSATSRAKFGSEEFEGLSGQLSAQKAGPPFLPLGRDF
jgi:hypothetical protein